MDNNNPITPALLHKALLSPPPFLDKRKGNFMLPRAKVSKIIRCRALGFNLKIQIQNFSTIKLYQRSNQSKPRSIHTPISLNLVKNWSFSIYISFDSIEMKASIKFRDDQKALFRAKVPLSILGMPFQSGMVAGESKELALNLATFFDSAPSLKISYRPNDPLNPFSLVFKTRIGRFGSPISSSPMTMSAEFNLIGNQNPTFFLHLKPQFGDFSFKKSQSSEFVRTIVKPRSNGAVSDDDRSVEVIDTPVLMKSAYSPGENGLFSGKQIAVLPSQSRAASLIGGLLSGSEASARTVLPVMNRAVVTFRWGLKFPDPAEEAAAAMAVKRDQLGWLSFRKFPLLVMNKIKVEHVVDRDSKDSNTVGPGLDVRRSDDVAETCLGLKHQLEIMQAENGILKKAVDDLKSEFGAGVVDSGKNKEGERRVKASCGSSRVDMRSSTGDKKSSD